jgi:Tfp pilus assembly protein PilO
MSTTSQANIQNKVNLVRRRFEDHLFVYRVYTLLALLSLFFAGYFGIFKMFKQIQEKRALEKQLTEVNTSLENNIAEFNRLQNDILSATGLVDEISLYMPSTFSTEEYVVQLSEAVSKSGFILRRVTSSESSNNEGGGNFVIVTAKADGPGDPVDLVKGIERLKRITRVTSFNYVLNTHSSVNGDGDATLSMEIYKSGGSQE